ncbi:peptidyl-prolyl cis-trans isomerase [Curvibacter sp. APW13]|uniref:peptidylprolyl isomerase n=1 Tax=Curvibacter sp. APW13 TaxID=3077236 RepID=UPI0028DF3FB5|nr:peptidyl-prolyl cis-trans isomerase [Curvibacter sp. APW13]MDT8989909.1 peptidyl-prolyl cis-trans isomerase [Curvibacter sp. APW13]
MARQAGMERVRRWGREPLVLFLLLGALIFVADYAISMRASGQKSTISVDADTLQRLRAQALQQWGRPPTQRQLDDLVEAHVREEVLVREARTQGLDQEDAIVRRRLAQKMEFLAHGEVQAPTEAEQRAYLAAHPERYQLAPRLRLEQVYVRPQATTQATQARLRRVRDALLAGAAEPGDRFMLGRMLPAQTPEQLVRDFGEPFAQAVQTLSPGAWSAPLASPYGWHLVRVLERVPGRVAPWEQVRDRVAADLGEARVAAARDDAYARLRARYTVVRADAQPQAVPGQALGSGR